MYYTGYDEATLFIIRDMIWQGRIEEAVFAAQNFGRVSKRQAVDFVVAYAGEVEHEIGTSKDIG